MKKVYTSFWLALLLVGFTTVSYGQSSSNCSGQFTITYPSGTGTATTTINNGTGDLTGSYCPSATASTALVVTPISNGILTLRRAIGTDTAVVMTINPSLAGTTHTFALPQIATQATYILASTIDCPNAKLKEFNLVLAPTLTVRASSAGTALGAQDAVCPGTRVTIEASGATSGSQYLLSAGGQVINSNTTGVFDVMPSESTTYTVATNTPTCGSDLVSQNIRVLTKNLVLESNDEDNNVQPGTEVILSTTQGTGGPYTYTANNGISTTTLAATSAQITVTPTRTTLYTVSGTTIESNCPSTVSLLITVNNAPLPIELVAFSAVWSGKGALLTWATATEKNNAYFVVERSLTGAEFQAVGQLAGAGTTPNRSTYRFTDNSVPQGSGRTLYYRLRQVDEDQTSTLSPVRTVQVPAAEQLFTASVFPNPYEKTASVQLDALEAGPVTFTVQNALGQTVRRLTATVATGLQTIALPETATLPAGIYYLTARQGKQQQVLKMIKR
ncbi:T9SS type A sorting domain-containing protein [Hymenobacter koreensis]|uniref:T9SS type A sorting domain-containing protein n=1 Tax=Hymenobacter koreensis TaxID=1084523 RepID=A0ABP8ITF1_9BACT